jgi:hypothetical protein
MKEEGKIICLRCKGIFLDCPFGTAKEYFGLHGGGYSCRRKSRSGPIPKPVPVGIDKEQKFLPGLGPQGKV